MGVATWTWRVQAGSSVALAATGTYPELKPIAPEDAFMRGVQGAPNDDCVTEWFFACPMSSA
jgi:hypothetical protein